ncbi:MAG: shikimate dehydrogenase family protein [Brevibacterium yomogidense]|uniref:shikimate dehydrogenase family protein n=1 Tax=Brevibacterium sp. Mu109 TaxID=1255669 RepID=UPI000C54E339|nr:shikimate dehydrogenase [Brevibacterium sp. Mu109]SMX67904.1 shikimate dehydrogenase [Brevibacterium sp. Mu109]
MGEFAVLGSPIAHSLSPQLHTAAAAAIGLTDFRYGRIEVQEAGLEALLDSHPALAGLSLTMPLKRRLLELAGARGWQVDADALATGGGNTLLRPPEGPVDVLNTDVAGIVEAITEALAERGAAAAPWSDAADVLGAGATAGSALVAAARLGIAHVRLFVRDRTRAGDARGVAESLGLTASVCDLPDWVPGERGLTLSTLPAGALDADRLPYRSSLEGLFFDVAYAASAAPVHRALADRGAIVVDGGRMLLHQAVEQHVRFARLAGLDESLAEQARPTIRDAMDAVLRSR